METNKKNPIDLYHWSEEEVALLKELYPKTLIRDLAKLFPVRTKATITAKAISLRLPSAKLWLKKDNALLLKHFQNAAKKELLLLFPRRSWPAILAQGERLGVDRNRKRPRIEVNESYFRKWSPQMAYVLGFIIADGCIIKGTYKGYSDALKLGVQLKDVDILEKIKRELHSGHTISVGKEAAHLTITSQQLVDDLKNLGLRYRKSLRETIPHRLPSKYKRELIRGIVDGDGSISFTKKDGYPQFSVCGSKAVVTFIRDYLSSKVTVYSKVTGRKKWEDSKSYLYYIGYRASSAKCIIIHLYENADLYLDRKFILAARCSKVSIQKRKDYSQQETQLIKKFYSTSPKDRLLSQLPTRSWNSIQHQAHTLGIYKYNIQQNKQYASPSGRKSN